MEDGTFQMAIAWGVGGGVKWIKKGEKVHKFLGIGGERLPFAPWGQDEVDGHLCRECGMLTLELTMTTQPFDPFAR